MIEKIGTNAGLVWHALEAGKLELKAIKKATKLTEKEIYAALGWLARENKVAIAEEGKEVFVELILKSASNLNGNLNCSKELEHYAS